MAGSEQFSAKVKLELVNCDTALPFSEPVEIPGLNGSIAARIALDEKTNTGSVMVKPGPVEDPKFLVVRPLTVRVRVVDAKKPDDPGVEKDIDAAGVPRDELAKNLTFGRTLATNNAWNLGRTQFYYEIPLTLLLAGDKQVQLYFLFKPFTFTPSTPPAAPQQEVLAVTVQVFGAYRSEAAAAAGAPAAKPVAVPVAAPAQ